MQPENNQNNWQQPPAAPSQAPYATPSVSEQNMASQPQQPVTPNVVEVPAAPVIAPTPIQAPVYSNNPVMAPSPAVQAGPGPVQPAEPQPVEPVTAPASAKYSETTPTEEPVDPLEVQPQDDSNEPEGDFSEEEPDLSDDTNEDGSVLLRWQGSEYLAHDRGKGWYVIMAVVVLILIALAILVLKSVTFAILVPVMAIALFIYTHRTPELLNYTLSHKGLHINDKLYTYDRFKSFGVMQYGEINSIVLIPRKRFQIGQTVYFPAEVGEQLVDMFAARLPMKEVKPDAIDKLLARLRI